MKNGSVIRQIIGQIVIISVLLLCNYAATPATTRVDVFKKVLFFQKYRFEAVTTATGSVRELVLKVFENEQTLVTIRQKTDGIVVNAEVADLDRNGSPEIYLYCCTYGSGSFGKVLGFQFFPDSFDAIRTLPLTPAQADGYMGHDAFAIQAGFLTRKFPVYRPGDANAQATGGSRTLRYALREIEGKLVLVAVI